MAIGNAPSGADLLCRALIGEGVEVLFGHPGGAILPFYDAIHRDGRLRHVLMRHESGAAHAADGYSRASGRVGVCVATSGPGATNLVTGLATAMMDSVPLVALTGQVARSVLGTDAFQETDVLGVTAPVTKYGFLVQAARDVPRVVDEAFRLARSGRPGPVVIDVPKDVQAEPCDQPDGTVRADAAGADERLEGEGSGGECVGTHERSGTGDRFRTGVPAGDVARAAAMLNAAERPLLMVGRGVLLGDVVSQVRRLAEWAEVPVVTTLLGLDAFPASHGLALGLPGMHGTPRANYAIQEADLVVGLGVRFDDRVVGRARDFAPRARLVHFEIDPTVVGRTVQPDLVVLGDLRATLPALLAQIRPRTRPAWLGRLETWERAAEPRRSVADPSARPAPREVIRSVAARVSRSKGIVVTDVGQHQMWLAQELPDVEPACHLTSGGLGTMGYALPAGIGAAVARPGREVWVVAGDGGFQMNIQELATVVQERLRLRIAVINNGYLGMVRQWQELFYDRRYSASEISGPDFAAVAAAYGLVSRKVARDGDVESALADASAADGSALVDLQVEREDNVYPIVPAGASLDELVTAPEAVAS